MVSPVCVYRDGSETYIQLDVYTASAPYTSSYYLIISIDKRLSSCERKHLDYSKSKMAWGSYLIILKYMYKE